MSVQAYTLPPDKLAQAIAFAHARHVLYFVSTVVSIAVLCLIMRLRVVPRLRRAGALWIVAAVVLITALCDLPAEAYGHSISLRYHISIESWPAWLWDWTKGQLISLVIAVAVLLPFYGLMRRSPRRWWLWAWLISIPVMIVSAYADPLILEPLFNRFQPLAQQHPELIAPIEKILDRAGVHIPTDHLFEMEASEKTNSLNAYMSGFGPSRRVVLYDTIIRKEAGAPLLTTIGHEVGHYVLNHIPKGLAFGAVCLLLGLWLIYRAAPWIVGRWGPALGIPDVADWASLPLLLLLVLALGFFAEPIGNAYSRRQEKEADLFSLQVTQGIVPDPGQAAAQALQVEGETDLEEPAPNPLVVFWLYSHPPVADRIRYSLEWRPQLSGSASTQISGRLR